MGTVFVHQLHDHLRSLRFQVSLVVLLVFFAANGVIYSWKCARLTQEMATIQADADRAYDQARTVSAAAGQYYQALSYPLGTEFIAEGGLYWYDDSAWVTAASERTPYQSASLRTLNNWMQRFEVVDWTLIVRLVLSFLCVVLAYDAVSGEMESGTLRLLLANPLSRGRLLAGKFLAHGSILLAALSVGTLVSLLVLSLGGVVDLDWRLARAYGLFLVGTSLYLTFFLFLTMGISALARRSVSALVLLVLLWAVVIVVIPQTSYLVAVKGEPSAGRWWEQAEQAVEQARQRLAREGVGLRSRELARADGYALEQRYAAGIRPAEEELLRLVQWAHDQDVRQAALAAKVDLLSPGFAFQYTVEAFLGTGLVRFESFLPQVRRYREHLRDFVRAQDAADPDSPHILFYPAFLSDAPLDPALVPRFREVPLPLAESTRRGLVPIVMLLLEAAGAFFFALWAFNRMDLSG